MNLKEKIAEIKEKSLQFRRTELLRKQFVHYPLVQFIESVKNETFSLYDYKFFLHHKGFSEDDINKLEPWQVPFRIKFYEATLFIIYNTLYRDSGENHPNRNFWHNDILPTKETLNNAYNLFCQLNNITDPEKKEQLKKHYFRTSAELNQINEVEETRVQVSRQKNYFLAHTKIPETKKKNKEKDKTKGMFRLAMINQYVGLKDFEASLNNKLEPQKKRRQVYFNILDEISKIKNCDLFIQPELSLPHPLIPKYAQNAALRQTGFIAGIEHWNVNDLGYNFILSVFPILVDGNEKDAIPIIRLKNHYAPEEDSWIYDEYKMTAPKPNQYRYDILTWKEIKLYSYYCYELSEISHRAGLFGLVDLLIAPVWNKDTNLYNNIVELTARDLHCYVALSNTSQYGDSRIVRPTSEIRRDKMRVKGGTEHDYPFTISVSDVDIKGLRAFQKKGFNAQKELNKEKKSFKPTPPDYDKKSVKNREKGEVELEKYRLLDKATGKVTTNNGGGKNE